mgnify:CR=1 FL=1
MTEEFSINNEQMGKRIRELREKEGLTQDALSEILSVGPNVIGCYEREEDPQIDLSVFWCIYGLSSIWRNGKCGGHHGAGRSFLGCG